MAAPSGEHAPPCSQSAADTAPLVRTRAPHGARANRGRTRAASSAVRTKLSAWRPLVRNGCKALIVCVTLCVTRGANRFRYHYERQ